MRLTAVDHNIAQHWPNSITLFRFVILFFFSLHTKSIQNINLEKNYYNIEID